MACVFSLYPYSTTVNGNFVFVIKRKVHTFMHNISNKDTSYKFMKFASSNFQSLIDNLALRNDKETFPDLEALRRDISNVECGSSLVSELLFLPNDIHPEVKQAKSSRLIKVSGEKKQPNKSLHSYDVLVEKDLLRIKDVKKYCGERSYFLIKSLAKLEYGLIEFSVNLLLAKGFKLISVPDILTSQIIDCCGMSTSGKRNQVYKLNSREYGFGWCLSGTAEMGLAAFVMNKEIPIKSLPLKLASVSRCYRAEISYLASEKGLYRVHQFTKVEMFSVCLPSESAIIMESFLNFQEYFVNSLQLHYQVIDIGPKDLGRQAFRKYDVEAWMPGYEKYGEVSSCSNCTDYQTSRLNIRCGNVPLHSLNATACAIPRTIIAITETHPADKGRVLVPKALESYTGIDIIGMNRGPRLHSVRRVPKQLSNLFIE